MSNPLYNQLGQGNTQMGGFFKQLNQLKQTFKGDPNEQIRQLLNTGRVSQAQYDQAVKRAQEIMRFMK